jgi:hypothetical protein
LRLADFFHFPRLAGTDGHYYAVYSRFPDGLKFAGGMPEYQGRYEDVKRGIITDIGTEVAFIHWFVISS